MRSVRRLLVIGSETQYGRRVIAGIHAYCSQHGNWEYHFEGDQSKTMENRARFAVRHWKAHGIIAQIRSAWVERLVRSFGLPVVNFSGVFDLNWPTVKVDNIAIGQMVARYFLNNGCKNFACCAHSAEEFTRLRCDAFADELRGAGFTCDIFRDHVVGCSEPDWVRNHKRIDRWLLGLKKPVAIMCVHDRRGQEVSWACRRLGLRVPDDVALVAVGNEEVLCRMCTPLLSSVETDTERVGYEAARLLDDMIRTRRRATGSVLVAPTRVIARASSDIIAVEDPDIAAAARFIRDHALELISVKDVLHEVPISRRALERRFIRFIGRTPREEIMRVRIDRAKSLLESTVLPISNIARASGFAGQEIFSVCFRRCTGKTPTQHRRDHRLVALAPELRTSLAQPAQ